MSITTAEFRSKITTHILTEKKLQAERITALTAYDYSTARLVDEAGVDVILVGDSLAQAMLGYENTLPVTMEEMLHHTRAVHRAVKRAFLITDMPFGSYHVSPRESLANAVRLVKEGGAEAVKIEGGEKRIGLIREILDAEIPVCGHIGLTPQSVHKMGGYKVQGKSLPAIEELMRDAAALDRAGVCLLVLEGIPREVAASVTAAVETPTIGIGAGPECDGQILVFHDLVNLTSTAPAKFVRRYADAGALIGDAVREYCKDVKAGTFPADEESYHLAKDSQAALAMAAGRSVESSHGRCLGNQVSKR